MFNIFKKKITNKYTVVIPYNEIMDAHAEFYEVYTDDEMYNMIASAYECGVHAYAIKNHFRRKQK